MVAQTLNSSCWCRFQTGMRPLWFGGGKLAQDLTLPSLRTRWPDTPEFAQEASEEWMAAKRHRRIVHERGGARRRGDGRLLQLEPVEAVRRQRQEVVLLRDARELRLAEHLHGRQAGELRQRARNVSSPSSVSSVVLTVPISSICPSTSPTCTCCPT